MSSNDELTVSDAQQAKHGYADETDIAKRKFGLDTPEANENPVAEEPEVPGERPEMTVALSSKVEDQEELLKAARFGDEETTTAEDEIETVEMRGSRQQTTSSRRDYDWSWSPKDRDVESETKPDEEVAESLGVADLPEADQSEKAEIPTRTDRREGETLAMYEERHGEEAVDEKLATKARAMAEEEPAPVEQASPTHSISDEVKYDGGWARTIEEMSDDDEGGLSPSRQRAEEARQAAAEVSIANETAPEPESEMAGRVDRELMDFDERAKLAAGLEPDESWSPKERIGEEIVDLGQYVEDVAEETRLTPGQALTLLCKERLKAGSAAEAAMNAIDVAASYFRVAPEEVPTISPRQWTATVEAEVKHLFTPWNESEYQVALLECVRSGHTVRFVVHEKTRDSRAWNEWAGDVVTDLREGDVVRVVDAKVHRGTKANSVKLHADQWTVIRRIEDGGGKHVTRHKPRERTIEHTERDLPDSLDEPAMKQQGAYHRNKSTLDERRAASPNGAETESNLPTREDADPTLVEWRYPAYLVPEKHRDWYKIEETDTNKAEA